MRQTSKSKIKTIVLPTAIPETVRAFLHVPTVFDDNTSGAGSIETDRNLVGENEVWSDEGVGTDGDIDGIIEGLLDGC